MIRNPPLFPLPGMIHRNFLKPSPAGMISPISGLITNAHCNLLYSVSERRSFILLLKIGVSMISKLLSSRISIRHWRILVKLNLRNSFSDIIDATRRDFLSTIFGQKNCSPLSRRAIRHCEPPQGRSNLFPARSPGCHHRTTAQEYYHRGRLGNRDRVAAAGIMPVLIGTGKLGPCPSAIARIS